MSRHREDRSTAGASEPVRTLDDVLARIADLAPLIAQRGPQIERERRLPADLVGALKSARVYGVLVPRHRGGLGLDAPGALRTVSALASLDGSAGWHVMIGQVGSLIPFPAAPELCDEILDDGGDHILAGSGQPVGTAERVPGGWKVTGVWPFASGCQDAEWILGACVMVEDGSPLPGSDGLLRGSRILPAERWGI